ncbi:MAG: ATP-binding protein [Chitinivibrionia bacterium]|nr:ATP-binding protein [Chitinivibrionia bacterium]
MFVRKKYLGKIAKGFKNVPIIVLIGARQVGKTSIMKSFEYGKKTLFLLGQDSQIAELFTDLSTIEHYLQIYLDEKLDGLLCIDEFQYINNISTIMKLLTDKHQNLKILCSGSSSLDILQKVEESLAGRVRIIETTSLSFDEYLLFCDDKLHKLYEKLDVNTPSSALTEPITQIFNEYLVFGGFPRVALEKNTEEKIELLNDIYQTYLLKDVRNYINNENFVGFNKLLRILATQTGNLVNINNLSKETGLPYKVCENYLYLLEQMYIIKMIEPYQTNKRKSIGKMKKLYFLDLGLRNIIQRNFNEIEFRTDNGAIFENQVMLELYRNRAAGGELQFYRISGGTEIDFVLTTAKKKMAFECKYKTLDKAISIAGLNIFCEEENIDEKYIINKNYNQFENQTRFLQGFFVEKVQ